MLPQQTKTVADFFKNQQAPQRRRYPEPPENKTVVPRNWRHEEEEQKQNVAHEVAGLSDRARNDGSCSS